MFNTAIIEVVVGLVFVFSLMAILVTQINNVVTTLLNTRAKELKNGLQMLITDDQVQAKMLSHPLIKIVEKSIPPGATLTPELARDIINSDMNKINWVDPATFVEALVTTLLTDAEGSLYSPLQTAINHMPSSMDKSAMRELMNQLQSSFSEPTLRHMLDVASKVEDPVQSQALMAGIQHIEKTLERLSLTSNQLVPLMNSLDKIDDRVLQKTLKTILATADSVKEAEAKITVWFDDTMTRVSTNFKHKMQLYSFITAFFIALFLNIDSLHLGRTLWEDPELRQAVTNVATEFDQESALTADTTRMPGAKSASAKDLERQVSEVEETIQTLLDLQLPVGWQYTAVTKKMVETSQTVGITNPRANPRNLWNYIPGNNDTNTLLALWFQKIIGFIATTIAAAQGAPFWFDILNKLTRRNN